MLQICGYFLQSSIVSTFSVIWNVVEFLLFVLVFWGILLCTAPTGHHTIIIVIIFLLCAVYSLTKYSECKMRYFTFRLSDMKDPWHDRDETSCTARCWLTQDSIWNVNTAELKTSSLNKPSKNIRRQAHTWNIMCEFMLHTYYML